MSKVLIDSDILTAIGDAIRAKNGAVEKYYPSEMAPAILALNICGQNVVIDLKSSEELSTGWLFKLMTSTYSASSNTYPSSVDDFSEVSIPHDWSIHQDFNQSAVCGYEGGFLDGGDAWYVKDIEVSAEDAGKQFIVNFDGVYSTCEVYMNGTKVGENHYGYNSFTFDVTNYVNTGRSNRLAVFVRNRQPSSRWYSGSGIFRKVHFIIGEAVNASIYDAYITTPNIATETNSVTTNFSLEYKSEFDITANVKISIYDESGDLFKESTFADVALNSTEKGKLSLDVVVDNPNRWNPMDSHWYAATIETTIGSNTYMTGPFTFGYRSITWDANGLYINGNKVFMKGVCMHHDLGILGSEINESAIDRQLRILKDMGCNAIRLTHNPSSAEYLDAAMKYGFILFEEMFDCWSQKKKTYDFAQYWSEYENVIKNTFERDKNNPAIIAWSMGNEVIRESNGNATKVAALKEDAANLVAAMKALDSIRPVTYGEDIPSQANAQALMENFDILGLNYGDSSEYATIRTKFPDKCIYGSETTSALSTRGCYANNESNLRYSSLDDMKVSWGDYAAVALNRHMSELPYAAGMFVWTGFDYIGEPTSYNKWPAKSSYFGIVDLAGFPKDVYYLYQQEWSSKPMVHAFPKWRGVVGSDTNIYVYSNCETVELFLNGESKGSLSKSDMDSSKRYRKFTIPYQIGTIVVNGYNSGELVAQDISYSQLMNVDGLKLTSDKTQVNNTNNDSLIFVECDTIDNNNTFKSVSDNTITFSCIGGEIIGTDAGDSASVESMRTNTKKAMNGKLLCMIKPLSTASQVVITATSGDLTSNELIVATGDKDIFTEYPQTFINASSPTIYNYPNGDDLNVHSDNPVEYNEIAIPEITSGSKFNIIENASYNLANNSFYVEFTLPENTSAVENVLSIGSKITSWLPGNGGYCLHLYSPINNDEDSIRFAFNSGTNTSGQWDGSFVTSDNRKVRLAISANGVYVNGIQVASNTAAGGSMTLGSGNGSAITPFFNAFVNSSTITIGSQEGSGRSTATYDAVRVYESALSNDELYQLTLAGDITNPTVNPSIEYYESPSSISLDATTQTIDRQLYNTGITKWSMLIGFSRSLASTGDIFDCGDFKITTDTKTNRVVVKLGNSETIDTNYSLSTDDYCQMFIVRSGSTYTVTRLDTNKQIAATADLGTSSESITLGSSTYTGNIDTLVIWGSEQSIDEATQKLPECTSFNVVNECSVNIGNSTVLQLTDITPMASLGRLISNLDINKDNDNVSVEISGGIKITGISEGQSLITVSYGSITKTINVTVNASVAYDDETILFSIDEDKVFGQTVGNGVDYAGLNTGVKLLDSDKDFTVFVKFTGSESNVVASDTHCLIHCMHESNPWPGMSFQQDGASVMAAHWWRGAINATGVNVRTTTPHSVAFVHSSGSNTVSLYIDGTFFSEITSSTTPTFNLDETCILGAYQTSSGILGRFWNGTIHNAKIYNITKSETEIAELHNS